MKKTIVAGLVVSLGIAGAISLLASEAPDGLETALQRFGVEEGEAVIAAPLADYQAPWFASAWLRQALAGVLGVVVVSVLLLGLGRVMAGKRNAPPNG